MSDKGKRPKRTAKDTVFTHIFGDKKYLLQLYQALHPEDTDVKEDDLTIITLENVLVKEIYNDLGFCLGDKVIFLVESQSTWTVNILIRVLLYLAKTYQDHIIRTEQNIYGSKKVVLPKPELYVIYTGNRKKRPEYISFAEEYFAEEKCCFDIKIKMIYDGVEGDIINQYVTFTQVFNEQVKKYKLTQKAVRETIRICKERNVLKEYLSKKESEVVNIMVTLFNEDEIMDMYVKSERKEAAAEAAVRSMVETCQDLGETINNTIIRIQTKFNLTRLDAQKMTEMYWK